MVRVRVLLGAALAIPVHAVAQEPVLLRLMPSAGQVSRYRSTIRMFINIPGMPAADPSQPAMLQCTATTETVDSVIGDVHVLRMSSDSTRIVMPSMPAGMPAQDAMRGVTMTVRRDSRGRVLSLVQDGPASVAAGALAGVVGGLSNNLPGLPEAPVRVGETWSDSVRIVLPVGAASTSGWLRLTSRLERLEGGAGHRFAVVSSRGTMSFGMTGQISMSTTGTSAGEVTWDLDRGRLARMASTTSGEIEVASMGTVMPFRMVMAMELSEGAGAAPVDTACAAVSVPPARRAAPDSAADEAWLAAMKSDLRNLVVAQESYFADHSAYTATLDSLRYRPSEGITVTLGVVSRYGWNATATHAGTPRMCGIFVGNAPTPVRGQYEGEPRCR